MNKAMIFAAGLGTRLRPITDKIPKALVAINGKPMLQIVIEQLKQQGINEIIINVHYLAEQIINFIQQNNQFGIKIEISDERDLILETGGGLLKVQPFFTESNEPFLVCNADIYTNINLQNFLAKHQENKSLATLAVRNRNSSRYLLFDDEQTLFGWENVKTHVFKIPRKSPREYFIDSDGEEKLKEHPLHEFAFSGYHIIEPEIFKYCNRSGVFSMTNWYLDLCPTHLIKSYIHNDDIWIDIGSQEKLAEAEKITL